MARTDNLTNYLEDIATAIKNKKGDDTPINASDFDTEIENLPSGGGSDALFSEIMNCNQLYARNNNIIDVVIPPLLRVTRTTGMFMNCKQLKTVTLSDMPLVTDINSMFNSCTKLESITMPSIATSNSTSFAYMCDGCSLLKNVSELDAIKCKQVNYVFGDCSNLINFGGFINLGQSYKTDQIENSAYYSLDFKVCSNLSYESAMNIINKVYDIASLGVKPQKIAFHANTLALLSDADIAIATEKGWSITA